MAKMSGGFVCIHDFIKASYSCDNFQSWADMHITKGMVEDGQSGEKSAVQRSRGRRSKAKAQAFQAIGGFHIRDSGSEPKRTGSFLVHHDESSYIPFSICVCLSRLLANMPPVQRKTLV